ncbi:MAG: response regulator [Sedimentisphaerales bacterium]|nr:response regulator [Sedimentisphaerales bacterium]
METLRVLVVDDEPGMLSSIQRVLRNTRIDLADLETQVNFDVQTSDTGEKALEIISNSPPDILLLDHQLPGMSGLDVLDNIADQKENILTVMITAYASLETAVVAIKRGAYDFLAKPFTPGELKATIRKTAKSLIVTRHARKLAREKRQVRFQFISVLAHELKSPIAALEGYLNIIKDKTAGDDPAVYEKMLDRCSIRLDGMRKLIFDLLDLTRIESGQKKRELNIVDLREIAQRSIESVLPQADSRSITINLLADEKLNMTADPGEIEIILNNLISNAVKYNRDNGRVNIVMTARNGKVNISVSDTGIGMSQQETDRLFNDFVRIKNAKTRNILGSGLGLSIMKKLVNLYEGEISVQSTPDAGTTFTAVLNQHIQQPQENAVLTQHTQQPQENDEHPTNHQVA